MYLEKLGWIASPFNPNKPDPRFILYEDVGREILILASRESSRIFYIYGKVGMGKSTLALWMSEVAKAYDLDPILIHGGRLYDPEIVKEKLKIIFKGPSFFRWLTNLIRGRRTVNYLVIVDDVTEIEDKNFFETLVGIIDHPNIYASICLFGNKRLEEWPYREVFTNRRIIVYELNKPSKDKILKMIESRVESVGGTGYGPLTLEEVFEIIEENETIRDILSALEIKVMEKVKAGYL